MFNNISLSRAINHLCFQEILNLLKSPKSQDFPQKTLKQINLISKKKNLLMNLGKEILFCLNRCFVLMYLSAYAAPSQESS